MNFIDSVTNYISDLFQFSSDNSFEKEFQEALESDDYDNSGATIQFDGEDVQNYDEWEKAGRPGADAYDETTPVEETTEVPEIVGSVDLKARMGLE